MYKVDHCLACGSGEVISYPAVMSSFVASYVLNRDPELTRLFECTGCSFRFFEDRYDSREVAALYLDYRGDEYFSSRHGCEPWYTKKMNDTIGKDPVEIQTRKAKLSGFISAYVDPARLSTVLDYGGDKGQFIPDQLGSARFVYDISKVEPVPGVVSLFEKSDVADNRFDLVMLCHVLEHCSEPLQVLAELKALAAKRGTLFCFEVPFEMYDLKFVPKSKRYEEYLKVVTGLKPLARALDFYSTVARVKFNVVPPLGFVKLHEHVNFFSVASMRALLERAGFEVRGCEVVTGEGFRFPSTVMCLAEAREH